MNEYPDAYQSIRDERDRQEAQWGEQNHHPVYWAGILTEELGEVAKVAIEGEPFAYRGQRTYGESNALLRAELVQLAAVAVAAIDHIDRRDAGIWHGGSREYRPPAAPVAPPRARRGTTHPRRHLDILG